MNYCYYIVDFRLSVLIWFPGGADNAADVTRRSFRQVRCSLRPSRRNGAADGLQLKGGSTPAAEYSGHQCCHSRPRTSSWIVSIYVVSFFIQLLLDLVSISQTSLEVNWFFWAFFAFLWNSSRWFRYSVQFYCNLRFHDLPGFCRCWWTKRKSTGIAKTTFKWRNSSGSRRNCAEMRMCGVSTWPTPCSCRRTSSARPLASTSLSLSRITIMYRSLRWIVD